MGVVSRSSRGARGDTAVGGDDAAFKSRERWSGARNRSPGERRAVSTVSHQRAVAGLRTRCCRFEDAPPISCACAHRRRGLIHGRGRGG